MILMMNFIYNFDLPFISKVILPSLPVLATFSNGSRGPSTLFENISSKSTTILPRLEIRITKSKYDTGSFSGNEVGSFSEQLTLKNETPTCLNSSD
jgi:hypothetical protein